ncbi:hypothetical protein EON77_14520, partial [bacterium]
MDRTNSSSPQGSLASHLAEATPSDGAGEQLGQRGDDYVGERPSEHVERTGRARPRSEGAAYTLGVIGGSGLYDVPGLEDVEELTIETPFGAPSGRVVSGTLRDEDGHAVRLLFLPRHGRGHEHSPSRVNYRANVCAMKIAGATHLLGVSAVGSMLEDIVPGDLVVVDQFIDLTKQRASTFFDDGIAAHVSFAEPVCKELALALANAAEYAVGQAHAPSPRAPRVHRSGTYVCMEGPQFSTRAESLVYRSWNVAVIG